MMFDAYALRMLMIKLLIFLTSGILQSIPLKEISSQDFRALKPVGLLMEKEMCQTHDLVK
jgi:hypothetical protein